LFQVRLAIKYIFIFSYIFFGSKIYLRIFKTFFLSTFSPPISTNLHFLIFSLFSHIRLTRTHAHNSDTDTKPPKHIIFPCVYLFYFQLSICLFPYISLSYLLSLSLSLTHIFFLLIIILFAGRKHHNAHHNRILIT